MTAKPCLGYATRTAAVAAMRAEGKSYAVIADAIGITAKQVGSLANGLKREYRFEPGVAQSGAMPINGELRLQLRKHAAVRNLSVDALIRVLLETIVDHGLVDAVMDDQEERRRA